MARLYVLVNHRANKAFKSDSQRLAVSLRSSIAKRCSHLNAALAPGWHQRLKVSVFIGFFSSLYT
ncbi:hypothetical protein CGH99_22810 [Vibrio parahaemolyticus]|nr:hypothetical protein [Vibrio parahaemolyticus]OQU55900.1 hypothetical protein EN02_000440 [Vibrio parahaemolyticus]TOL34372.1 hypothetical protein CGH99_22810 [Vibrio parahaemolyticus]TOL46114.1 hypothetical protein CGH96_22445 [Vibrio parahaemolyticus]TOL65267.1 hypothetical protein CGH92_24525 [Vibrio parahaemolyticus]